MRLKQRHRRGPAAVGNSPDTRSPVVARHILDKPIQCVPRVCTLIDPMSVLISRVSIHHEFTFRFKAASQILPHEDISITDQLFEEPAGGAQFFVGIWNPVWSTCE